ncbi:Aspartate_aminotransferase [Hexamita inflata]|uniref:Aspartate aminotransferase n=1 Tax=Hexamita inflata TaxID=28002 RepID=A0AA86UC35_9EUKA|nr:Aspartate aminotransferase [Hexamita inflata]
MLSFKDIKNNKSNNPFATVAQKYAEDKNENKLLLTMGMIVNENNQILSLKSVEKAEKYLAENQYSKAYPSTAGVAGFLEVSQSLLKLKKSEVSSVATPSCGAFAVAFDLLKLMGVTKVNVLTPTWPMYYQFLRNKHLDIGEILYFQNGRVQFENVVSAINAMQPNESIIFQAGCYNPVGVDFTAEQFQTLANLCRNKNVIPVIDVAYQGIKQSITQDTDFACFNTNSILIQFFDKNFGIYAEGCSCVHATSNNCQQLLEDFVSSNFGAVPVHGQYLVETVYKHFFEEYIVEMEAVREQIHKTKEILFKCLEELGYRGNLKEQNGIFGYFDLNEAQVEKLQTLGLYVMGGGRINIGQVNAGNAQYIAECIVKVMQ